MRQLTATTRAPFPCPHMPSSPSCQPKEEDTLYSRSPCNEHFFENDCPINLPLKDDKSTLKTRGFDFGGAFCIFRGSGQRHRQMELFSLQMFDNERGRGVQWGWGEKWNIHEQRTLWRFTPGSGCQNSSVLPLKRHP